MKNIIHTVIFDMDGTLADSAILTMAAFRQIAPAYGLPLPSEEALRRACGIPNPEYYYVLFPDHDRETIFNMGQMIEKAEGEILPSVRDKILFPGCRELLTSLRENGISMNIASTGGREHVFSILREAAIINMFDEISCGRPDKTIMLRDMIKGGKSGYVMVGDMEKDYKSARANGILSVGACYGYCKREISEFDLYIDTPRELLGILGV